MDTTNATVTAETVTTTAKTDEAQYRRRCYYIRLLTVVGMNLCLWLTTYLMSPTPVVPATAPQHGSHSTVDFVTPGAASRYADGYRPLFRVAMDREALSVSTAKDSLYFTALIASAFFVLTVAIRFGSRLVGMAEGESVDVWDGSFGAAMIQSMAPCGDTTSDKSPTSGPPLSGSPSKSQELTTFLEMGKSFLSPEFLKEMLEEEAPSLAVKSPPIVASSMLDTIGAIPSPPNSLYGDDTPPGLHTACDIVESGVEGIADEEAVAEPKPACDVRNWRFADRTPSLSNNRTLTAFHNLNASRKVAHHFYPDPQTLAKQPSRPRVRHTK